MGGGRSALCGGASPPARGAVYLRGLGWRRARKGPFLPALWLSPSLLFMGYLCVSLLTLAIGPNSTFRNPRLESACLGWFCPWGSAHVPGGDAAGGAHTAPGLGGTGGTMATVGRCHHSGGEGKQPVRPCACVPIHVSGATPRRWPHCCVASLWGAGH